MKDQKQIDEENNCDCQCHCSRKIADHKHKFYTCKHCSDKDSVERGGRGV